MASKHLELKELWFYVKMAAVMFFIPAAVGFLSLSFDMLVATYAFALSSVYGVLVILFAISYHGRLQRETMAKMLGKDFMDFCVCRHCEKERKK